MTRQRLTRLFAALAVVAAATWRDPPDDGRGCGRSRVPVGHRGFDENRWLGGPGTWSDATHWSKGVVPGLATQDYACIPRAPTSWSTTRRRRASTWTSWSWVGTPGSPCSPGTAMFVWGDQDDGPLDHQAGLASSTSTAPPWAVGGRLHVIGTLDVHASTHGAPPPC